MIDLDRFVEDTFTHATRIGNLRWVGPHAEKIAYDENLHNQHSSFEQDSFWFRHRNNIFNDLISRFNVTQPLVDMGGGTGIVAEALQTSGVVTLNLEPTEFGALCSVGRGVPTLQATLQEAGANANSLPSVGLFDVLEHIDKDAETLLGIYEALRPGGCLIVAVPAYRWLWSNEDLNAEHCRRYTRNTLVADLAVAGFRIEFSSYLFSFLVAPVFALRTAPSLGGRIRRSIQENTRERHVLGGFPRLAVDALVSWERNHLASGRSLPFGTSVIAVARKPM
jgi:SAM-dependent methyltransferase